MEELLGTIFAGLAIYGTISLIWCIIMIVANWKIFTKAGQPGWMSIIPFLNSFILFKISWNTTLLVVYLTLLQEKREVFFLSLHLSVI